VNIHSGATYESLNWRDRTKERKRRADELNDTLAAYHRFYWRVRLADLALSPYGIRLIPNDRVFHIYEEPDRRKVSGSVGDGRKLIWRKPVVGDYPYPRPTKLRNGPKLPKCAHRNWKSAKQMSALYTKPVQPRGIGRAWTDDAAARDVLLMLKAAALDRGAPVPLCRQQEALTGRSSERRSYLVERGVAYSGAAIGHGGATKEEKRRQTILDGQVNAAAAELRAMEKPAKWQRTTPSKNPAYWSGQSRPRPGWMMETRWFWITGFRIVVHEQLIPEIIRQSRIPPPTGNNASVFTGKMQDHPAWPWISSRYATEISKAHWETLKVKPQWEVYVLHEIYNVTMTDQSGYL
jgi:hypothetical protein